MEEKYKRKQANNKKHRRVRNPVLKASGAAIISNLKKKKKAGPRDRKELSLGHTAGTVGSGVLLSELDRAMRHRAVGCGSRDWLWLRHCPYALQMASLPPSKPLGLTGTF